MKLKIRFAGDKRLACSKLEAWGGPVISWDAVSAPKIARGTWAPDGRGKGFGGSMLCEAEPGQLLLYGSQRYRGRFVSFGLAWRHFDGDLIGQPLLNGYETAMPIYLAGGWREPELDVEPTKDAIAAAAAHRDLAALTTAIGIYMENHLLTGAPVQNELTQDGSAELMLRLSRQAEAWPEHREVLLATASAITRLY